MTEGHKKISNFLRALHRKEDFYKDLERIREDLGIAPGGEETPEGGLDVIFGPILPPKLQDDETQAKLVQHLKNLVLKHKMGPVSSELQLLAILVMYDICYIPPELDNVYTAHYAELKNKSLEYIKRHNYTYPVAIYLSPYTTLNDLKSYLNKNFTRKIKPILKAYKDRGSNIGKVRSRSRADIADFIYEKSKTLGSGKRLYKAMVDNFGAEESPDPGTMNKLLSEERKRRGEKK